MHLSPQTLPAGRVSYRLNLIEYGDYTSLACRKFQQVLPIILPIFNERVSYMFRHFPNLNEPASLLLARAAEAARQQNQHTLMHQALFTQALPVSITGILKIAQEIGLDLNRFMIDFYDDTLSQRIWADMQQGRTEGVETTPALFLGTRLVHGKLTQARVVSLLHHYVSPQE